MRKRLLALGVVVIIIVSAAGCAFADAWGWGRGMGRLDRAEDVPTRIQAVRALELTGEQVESIQAILQQTMQGQSTQEQIESVLTARQLEVWSTANANMRAQRGRPPPI